jgi:hypothetical protein
MKTLEIIHLRLGGNSQHGLIEVIRKSIDSENDPLEARIYRHASLENDLAVHLHREIAGKSDHSSDLGVRLASVLREHGMVEHSVWVEENETRG